MLGVTQKQTGLRVIFALLPVSALVAIVMLAIAGSGGEAPTEEATPPQHEQRLFQASDPEVSGDESQTAIVTDPYEGWGAWCEPMWYEKACKEHGDCAGIKHVARRPLRCVHPQWARKDNLKDEDGEPLKVCAPGFSVKSERRWRRARLRELVSHAYFDEDAHCPDWSWKVLGTRSKRFERKWSNGRPTHKQHWRCTQEWSNAEKLADFLWVPYFRETSARPWKRHRLNKDVAANRKAWVREAHDYGWVVELQCEDGRPLTQGPDSVWRDTKGRRCGKGRDRNGRYTRDRHVIADYYPDPHAEQHNPYYGERYRWEYGNGGVGKNTAYGTQDWDMMAPPEILCREIQGFESYLRDCRHAVHVLRGDGVDCGEATRYRGLAIQQVVDPQTKEVIKEDVEEPSWEDVHRVASGGKFCPRKGKNASWYRDRFRARMKSVGLRATEPVTIEMLGRPLAKETQNERAAEILNILEAKLPPPW